MVAVQNIDDVIQVNTYSIYLQQPTIIHQIFAFHEEISK